MEQIKEKINVFKKKFSTNIKLKSIEYYKIHGALKK